MNYHNITKDDMLNGEGLRVVLWVAGCNHRCPGCQNPQTWDVEGGIPFDETAKQELFAELEKPYIDGITFSGGDPVHPCNRQSIYELAREIKEKYPNKTVWIYTGYTYEQIQEKELIKYIDVLVDGPYIKSRRDLNLEYRGSSNQRIIRLSKN
ncbi:anaerobic ribonucleoside-triphosphate reductase activating protein [Thomasclavelia spiroformis]|uniref:anaerobic ribonucleoside-triphosphate reductase activating protein n=1 Tax=Thomasclavelia spiroformis TaxID=29348 RepID=UPI003990B91A